VIYQVLQAASRQNWTNLVNWSKSEFRRRPVAEQLKLPEVARRLGVSEKTARRYVKSGALPSMFVGGAYRVSEEDLKGFLQGAKVTPSGGPPKAPASSQPSFFNGLLEEERRSRYLNAWRAFVWKLKQRWEEEPPQTSREIAVVLDTMQALIDEGAFEQPQEQITASDWRTASEGIELQALFMGLRRLNEIADDVEQDETAQQRRELLQALPGGKSA
jgi:excisionase family DNA binding protein